MNLIDVLIPLLKSLRCSLFESTVVEVMVEMKLTEVSLCAVTNVNHLRMQLVHQVYNTQFTISCADLQLYVFLSFISITVVTVSRCIHTTLPSPFKNPTAPFHFCAAWPRLVPGRSSATMRSIVVIWIPGTCVMRIN